jgi:zinc transporter ZupT
MGGLATFDAAAIAATLVMSIVGIAVPLCGAGTLWKGPLVEVFAYFTAGVFLGVGMIHMLPEAAAAPPCSSSPILAALINPFALFCVGYILVWAIENSHPASKSAKSVTKHNILAVATRAHYSSSTASVCFVDVPPVTTYHRRSSASPALSGEVGLQSSLLQNDMLPPPALSRSKSEPTNRPPPAATDPGAHVYTHGNSDVFTHGSPALAPAPARRGEGDTPNGGAVFALDCGECGEVDYDHAHAHPNEAPPLHECGECGECGSGQEQRAVGTRGVHEHVHEHGEWCNHCEHEHEHQHGDWCSHDAEGPMHSHVHPGVRHGHLVIGGSGNQSHSALPLLLTLLFSVHSLIAGLALGIQPAADASALAILIAILGHKWIEALSLASNFVKEGVTARSSVSVLIVYILATPAGIVAGAYFARLVHGSRVAMGLVGGFAAGSFVALGAHELTSQPHGRVSARTQVVLALAGVVCMAILSVWT